MDRPIAKELGQNPGSARYPEQDTLRPTPVECVPYAAVGPGIQGRVYPLHMHWPAWGVYSQVTIYQTGQEEVAVY